MGSNADLVRGVYDAFGKGDVPAVLGAMAEKIDWREPEFSPYQEASTPQEVAERVFGPVIGDFPDFSVTPSEIHDAGDVVVALGTFRGTSAATGGKLDVTYAHVWRLQDGKIVGFRTYNESLGWLKALGKA
jgi:ketosteroid isomerase-like protein